MQSRLFEVDPMAGVGYAMYNSVKKGKGSFEDFLLHYDSVKVNEGDDDWLSKLINEDSLSQVTSPQMLEAMNKYGVNSLDMLPKLLVSIVKNQQLFCFRKLKKAVNGIGCNKKLQLS